MNPTTIAAAIAALNAEYLQNLTSLSTLPAVSMASNGRSIAVEAARGSLLERNKQILAELQLLQPIDFTVAGMAGY